MRVKWAIVGAVRFMHENGVCGQEHCWQHNQS